MSLRCMTSQHPSSWSERLLWVEYTEHTDQFRHGPLHLPERLLFKALEREASCPLVQAFIRDAAGHYSSASNRHRSQAPE